MSGRNGGAMGKKKRNTEKDAKKNKVVTMPRTDGGKDVEGQEEGKKKPSAKKALRSAAKKAVENDCGKLAGTLVDRAEQGDLHSAEVLLALIEKKKKKKGGEDDGLDGPSLAEQLMEGPTWEEVLEAKRLAKEEEEAEAAAS